MPEFPAKANLTCGACSRPLRAGALFCAACGQQPQGTVARDALPLSAPSQKAIEANWGEVKLVATVFAFVLGWVVGLSLVWRDAATPLPDVTASIGLAIIVILFGVSRGRTIAPLFAPPRLTASESAKLFGISVVALGGVALYFVLLYRLGVPIVQLSQPYLRAGWPVWTIFVFGSLMPGIFEEIGFRGVIQTALERVVSGREAWIIQAALFSVLHLSPIIFPSHFILGLLLGYARRTSGSLYPGMILHMAWNASVLGIELLHA